MTPPSFNIGCQKINLFSILAVITFKRGRGKIAKSRSTLASLLSRWNMILSASWRIMRAIIIVEKMNSTQEEVKDSLVFRTPGSSKIINIEFFYLI